VEGEASEGEEVTEAATGWEDGLLVGLMGLMRLFVVMIYEVMRYEVMRLYVVRRLYVVMRYEVVCFQLCSRMGQGDVPRPRRWRDGDMLLGRKSWRDWWIVRLWYCWVVVVLLGSARMGWRVFCADPVYPSKTYRDREAGICRCSCCFVDLSVYAEDELARLFGPLIPEMPKSLKVSSVAGLPQDVLRMLKH
jgi:hypothetical protein